LSARKRIKTDPCRWTLKLTRSQKLIRPYLQALGAPKGEAYEAWVGTGHAVAMLRVWVGHLTALEQTPPVASLLGLCLDALKDGPTLSPTTEAALQEPVAAYAMNIWRWYLVDLDPHPVTDDTVAAFMRMTLPR
jgi:hypothetical protein